MHYIAFYGPFKAC